MNRRQLLIRMALLTGASARAAGAEGSGGPPPDPVQQGVLSGDTRFAAMVSERGTIRVWDTVTGEMPYALPPSPGATAQLSPDARYLATSAPHFDRGQTALREAKSGKVLWERKSFGSTQFEFTHDGRLLLMVTALPTRRLSYTMDIIEVPGGKSLWPLERTWDRTVWTVSPDSSTLAVRTYEKGMPVITLQELQAGAVRCRIPVESWVGQLAFSPDGKLLAVAVGGGEVEFRDTTSGRLQGRLPEPPLGKSAETPDLLFSPDGKWLATAPLPRDRPDRAASLRLWNPRTGAAGPVLAEANGVQQPVFSTDGTLLAAIHGSGVLRVWDVRSGALLRSLETPPLAARSPWPVGEHRFTPDSAHLVAVSPTGIRRWEVRTGKLEQFFPFR